MVDSSPLPALSLEQIPLGYIYTSPHQMRRHFDLSALKELADSMKQEGLIQPITVRKVGSAYELVVGERRLKAAKMLKWETIDARVIDISDEDAAVKGLIENLQRVDLSPIEEARGYKQLVEQPYELTQGAIAQRVGKCQAAIARCLALLELPQEIQDLIPRGIITESHTRSLRKIPDRAKQVSLARKAHREGWTTKQTERQVHQLLKEMGVRVKQRETQAAFSPEDPLAKLWEHVHQTADQTGVRVVAVRYRKRGKWSLELETGKAGDPKTAFADFFARLGQILNGPIPNDLPSTPK